MTGTTTTGTATTGKDWSAHRGLVALAVGYRWFYNGADFLASKEWWRTWRRDIVCENLF